MPQFIYKNHQLLEEKQALISINERGFLFGDGIFETCKIFDGKIYDFKSHEARIRDGLKALKFSAEISDLEKKSLQLIKKNKIFHSWKCVIGLIDSGPRHSTGWQVEENSTHSVTPSNDGV